MREAASNVTKHGVSFEEAATVQADPLALVAEDANYTEGDEDTIRIIGARRDVAREEAL